MNYPYDGDTMLIIDIQAANQLEILTCVRETFSFMPGWVFNSSAKSSPKDARFYIFNLSCHTFSWWRTNESLSDTMDADEVVIKDLADISHLLEFIYENTEALRHQSECVNAFGSLYGNVMPKKIHEKGIDFDLAEKMQEAYDYIKKFSHPEGFIKIKPMSHLPTDTVFYNGVSKKPVKPYPPKKTQSVVFDSKMEEMEALMVAQMEAYFTYSEKKQMAKACAEHNNDIQWYEYEHSKYEGVMIKPHALSAMADDLHHYYSTDSSPT
jgi:hypothetical protein